MRMVQYAYRGGMVLETLQFLNERRPLEVEELGGLAFVAAGSGERQVDQITLDLRDEGGYPSEAGVSLLIAAQAVIASPGFASGDPERPTALTDCARTLPGKKVWSANNLSHVIHR